LKNEQWAAIENADHEDAAFRLSLPVSARRASTDRYFFMRREAVGEKLSNKEQDKLHELNLFYNAAYLPLRTLIKEAEGQGSKTSNYRKLMNTYAENPLALVNNPPPSIEKNVKTYLYGISVSATKNLPAAKDYTGRHEDYADAKEAYVESLQQRQNRMRYLIPTFSKAKELLDHEYRNKHGGIRDKSRSVYTKKRSYIQRLDKLKALYANDSK